MKVTDFRSFFDKKTEVQNAFESDLTQYLSFGDGIVTQRAVT